jgi:methionine-rich copper-binding protein CopC/putative copper export protein
VRTPSRLRAIALAIAAVAVIATPALVFAHARLVRSTPPADSTLATAPQSLTLWFSERPELRFSTVRLVDSSGTSIPIGALAKLPGDPAALTAPIPAPLANGRYTVHWRTAADDGHPTSGAFSFAVLVAEHATVAATDTARAPRRPAPNAIVETAPTTSMSTAIRWADLVAVLSLVGVMVFVLFVVPRAQLPGEVASEALDRARRLGNAVLFLFAVTTLWRLSAQADLVPTAAIARTAAMVTVVRETKWGAGWLVGAAGGLLTLLGLMMARSGRRGWFVAGVGVVAIVFSLGLTGHPAASSNVPLASAVDVAHVLGAGGWMGGLAAVALCGLVATKRADAGGTRLSQQLIRSYHKAAVECVAIVLVTSVIAIGIAWFRLGQPTVFWTSAYGRILLIKMSFAVVLLAFGFYHWRTAVIPEWTDDTGFRFKRSIAFELLIGAGIIGVTAVLITTGLTRS